MMREPIEQRADLHSWGCNCEACGEYPPATLADFERWSAEAMWVLAGAAFANAVIFVIDPHGAWHALAGFLGVR